MSGPLRLLLLAAALLTGACERLDRRGMLLMLEPGYEAETILANADGIVAPDGLRWADGRLWIADEGGSAVRVWSPEEGLRTLAGPELGLLSPEDLVRDAAGNLYVTDDDAGGLWRIDAAGRASRFVEARPGMTATEGIALAPSGAILVGDGESGTVFSVTPEGAVSVLLGPERGIAKPESMAFDGEGNLWIADNREDLLYVLTPDGRLHRPIRNREAFSPETIHHDGRGLLITDSANGKLYRYTPQDGLAAIAVFGGEIANLHGVASDEAGNIYLSVQTDLKSGRGSIIRLRPRSVSR